MPRTPHPARPAHRVLAGGAAVVAALALGACSGGDDGGSDPSSGASSSSSPSSPSSSGSADGGTPSSAEQVVVDWLTGTVDGDVAACDLELPAFTRLANEATAETLGRGTGSVTCEQRIRRSAAALGDIGGAQYEEAIKGAQVTATEETDGPGGTATVEVLYEGGSTEPTVFELVVRDGDWLIASDSAIAAPGQG